MNSLRDVHRLHCGGKPIEKAKRDVFVEGNMTDVREQFQVGVLCERKLIISLCSVKKNLHNHSVCVERLGGGPEDYYTVKEVWFSYLI